MLLAVGVGVRKGSTEHTEYRGIWGVEPPPPKFRSFDKAEPNSQFSNNTIRIRDSVICNLSGTPD
jgi:hypothetical protein